MTAEATGAAVLVSTFSALLLNFLGVDYYALLWASFGALGALLYTPPSRKRLPAAFWVILSTLLGAGLGTALAEHVANGSRSALMVFSAVSATAPQLVIAAILKRLVGEIGRGSPKNPTDTSAQ